MNREEEKKEVIQEETDGRNRGQTRRESEEGEREY